VVYLFDLFRLGKGRVVVMCVKLKTLVTRKTIALKKVRFDNLQLESLKFMAREILVLRKLDHPNVVNLEGLVTSRMSCTVYLVFE